MIYSIGRLIRRLRSSRPTKPVHRVAIAHDYLTQRGGAERVVLALHRAFPEAPIYTTLYNPETTFPEFRDARIVTSWLNRIPYFRTHHRAALPLLPFAASGLRVSAGLTLVSSTGWAHGFAITGRRLVYCHIPARWLYLSEEYIGDEKRGSAVDKILARLKPALLEWDRQAVQRGTQPYLGNSTVVAQRIFDVYGIEAPIVFPPHSVDASAPTEPIPGVDWGEGEFFLIVSRLLPYKNVQHAVAAVRESGHRLLVIGAGPMGRTLRAHAPENVRFASGVSDAQMRWAYAHCRAVLAVSYEDFGITPLEGAAYGKPTLGLHAGGFLDTIRPGETGTWIEAPEPREIRLAIEAFDPADYDPGLIKAHAETFSEERFVRQIREQLERLGYDAG